MSKRICAAASSDSDSDIEEKGRSSKSKKSQQRKIAAAKLTIGEWNDVKATLVALKDMLAALKDEQKKMRQKARERDRKIREMVTLSPSAQQSRPTQLVAPYLNYTPSQEQYGPPQQQQQLQQQQQQQQPLHQAHLQAQYPLQELIDSDSNKKIESAGSGKRCQIYKEFRPTRQSTAACTLIYAAVFQSTPRAKSAVAQGNTLIERKFGVKPSKFRPIINSHFIKRLAHLFQSDISLFSTLAVKGQPRPPFKSLFRTIFGYGKHLVLIRHPRGERFSYGKNLSSAIHQSFVCRYCGRVYVSLNSYSRHKRLCAFGGTSHVRIAYDDNHRLVEPKLIHLRGLAYRSQKTTLFDQLLKLGICTPSDFQHLTSFEPLVCTCDVESFSRRRDDDVDFLDLPAESNRRDSIVGVQSLASMAIAASLPCGTYRKATVFLEDDPQAVGRCLTQAVGHLLCLSRKAEAEMRKRYFHIFYRLEQIVNAAPVADARKSSPFIKFAKNVLASLEVFCRRLPCLFYNGEYAYPRPRPHIILLGTRYDCSILNSGGLLDLLNELDGPVVVVKKAGNSTHMIQSKSICILDMLAFSSQRVSLATFLERYSRGNQNALKSILYPFRALKSPLSFRRELDTLRLTHFRNEIRGTNQLTTIVDKYALLTNIQGLSSEQAMRQMAITEPPISAEVHLAALKRVWRNEGLHTLGQLTVHYNSRDVEPLLDLAIEMARSYGQLLQMPIIDLYRSFTSLSSLSYAASVYSCADELLYTYLDPDTANCFLSNIRGGISDCCHSLLEIGQKIKPYIYKDKAKTIRSILSYDIRSAYNYCLMADNVIGTGVYAVRYSETSFTPFYAGRPGHVSYLLSQFAAYKYPGCPVYSRYSVRGERRIAVRKTPGIAPSGYVFADVLVQTDKDRAPIVFESDECSLCRADDPHSGLYVGNNASHGPSNSCQRRWEKAGKVIPPTMLRAKETTRRRLALIAERGYHTVQVYSCEFARSIMGDDCCPPLSRQFYIFGKVFRGAPTIYRKTYNSIKLIAKDIRKRRLQGYVELTGYIPQECRLDFEFPPIYRPRKVAKEDMNPETTLAYAERHGIRLAGSKTLLCGEYDTGPDPILLHTELIRFYQIHYDFRITSVRRIVEYRMSVSPFKPFFERLTQLRADAKAADNEYQADLQKAVMVAVYGSCLTSTRKRIKTVLVTKERLAEYLRSERFQGMTTVGFEQPTDLFAVSMVSEKAVCRFATQIGVAVLNISKLLLYRWHRFLTRYISPTDYALAYIETDSYTLAISDERGLEALVPPHLINKFNAEKQQYFGPEVGKFVPLERKIVSVVVTGLKSNSMLFEDGGSKGVSKAIPRGHVGNRDFFSHETMRRTVIEKMPPQVCIDAGLRQFSGQMPIFLKTKTCLSQINCKRYELAYGCFAHIPFSFLESHPDYFDKSVMGATFRRARAEAVDEATAANERAAAADRRATSAEACATAAADRAATAENRVASAEACATAANNRAAAADGRAATAEGCATTASDRVAAAENRAAVAERALKELRRDYQRQQPQRSETAVSSGPAQRTGGAAASAHGAGTPGTAAGSSGLPQQPAGPSVLGNEPRCGGRKQQNVGVRLPANNNGLALHPPASHAGRMHHLPEQRQENYSLHQQQQPHQQQQQFVQDQQPQQQPQYDNFLQQLQYQTDQLLLQPAQKSAAEALNHIFNS